MSEFFNSNQKTPFVLVETADGKVKLGVNEPITVANDFNDVYSMTNLKVECRSNFIDIELDIEILPGAWTNRSFDDVLAPLVEEPYRTSNQRPEDDTTGTTNQDRGVWVIQFGWRNQSGEDFLSPRMRCVTLNNTLSVLPEARGAIQLKKSMIMLPLTYLNDMMLSDMQNVREYATLSTADVNEAQNNILPIRVFEELAKDLIAVYGTNQPFLPKLEHFLAIGENFLNVGAEDAYYEWMESPLRNTSAFMMINDTNKRGNVSARLWLDMWLHENQMEMFPIPLRFLGGAPPFIVRYAATDYDPNPEQGTESKTESHEQSLNKEGRKLETFRYAWTPALDILSKDSIVENAALSYEDGIKSAAYLKSFRQRFTPKTNTQNNELLGEQADEQETEEQEKIDNRNLFMEVLKLPHKKAALTLMGQPYICVMDVVPVYTNNPLFDGLYQIIGVIHNINKQGFTTDIDCYRIGTDVESSVANIQQGKIVL